MSELVRDHSQLVRDLAFHYSKPIWITAKKSPDINSAVFLGETIEPEPPENPFDGGRFISINPILKREESFVSPIYVDVTEFERHGSPSITLARGVWVVTKSLPNNRIQISPTWDYSESELESLLETVGYPEEASEVSIQQFDVSRMINDILVGANDE